MNSCNKYNQYATDVLDQDGNLITIKCFDGDDIYAEQKTFNVNSYKDYKNKDYYSWINRNFMDYSFDEENYDNSFDKICNGVSYSLKQQQKFAGRIFNTHTDTNSMLIYHGLGSGKTQTSIVIGEAFKDQTVKGKPLSGRADSHVFIVVPAALEKQYYAEIIGKIESGVIKAASGQIVIEGERQFYGSELARTQLLRYDTQINSFKSQKEKLMNERGNPIVINDLQTKIDDLVGKINRVIEDQNSKVTTVYEIFSHETFLNRLFKIDSNGKFVPQFLDPDGGRLDFLNIKNGLLIIDEIQNLVSATGTNYRRLLYALTYYAAPNYRTVFLTGTPIYDKPYEFGLLMNLMRTRVPFPDGKDSFNEVFLEDDSVFKNVDYFKKMCSGYISYFKGGNPVAYPYKKTTVMYHQMNEYQYSQYCVALVKEVKKDLPGPRNDDYFVSVTKDDNKMSSGIFNNSNQLANIAFPEYRGTKYMKNALEASISQFKTDLNAVLNEYSKTLPAYRVREIDPLTEKILEFVGGFSSKFAKVAEMCINSDGPIFIFSNYVTYGVNALAIIMNYLGYAPLHSKETSIRGRYFVWNGEANSKHPAQVEEAYKLFNSPENVDGSKLKIMFGTQTVMEGVDFKNVDQIHILDSWWNDSRMQQIIARGIRLCSHKNLPPEKRIVNVFIHLAALGSYEKIYELSIRDSHGTSKKVITDMQVVNKGASPEELLIREYYVTKPDKEQNVEIKPSSTYFTLSQINLPENSSISDILTKNILVSGDRALIKLFGGYNHKNLASISVQQYMYNRSQSKLNVNRQFEKAIKEVAFDCTINKNGNVIRLDELYIPSTYYNGLWELYYENYSTGERFIRLGVKSKYQEKFQRKYGSYVENNFFLEDILENVALKSTNYTFKSLNDGSILKTNTSLILSENIKCEAEKYTFRFPKKLVDLTINKQMIPYLVKMVDSDKTLFFSILLSIINKDGPLQFDDPDLSRNLRTFLVKRTEKRKKLIDKLKEEGFQNNTDWESLGTKELETTLTFLIKK